MRRYAVLVGASLMAFYAGCSSDPSEAPDDGIDDDAGVRDDGGRKPDPVVEPDASDPVDASDPGDADPDAGVRAEGFDPDFSLPGVAGKPAASVLAMAPLSNRQIVVGGNFEYAGDVPAKRIAIWNGSKWATVGAGFSDRVVKLATNVATGEIYAVTANEPTFHLHKWSQQKWTEIGTFNGNVRSLELASNGTLYAAGTFTTVDDQPLQGLAKFDGTTWSTLGAPPRSLYAFRMIGNEPCIGGKIGESDSVGVACFDGSSWKSREANMASGTIHVLGEQGGQLIATGRFALKDKNGNAESVGSLARWNGTQWELIGGGMSDYAGFANVSDMVIAGTKIYVIGSIARVGTSTNVQSVAAWDTATNRWSDLNGGLGGVTGNIMVALGQALTVGSGGEVYAGGYFSLTSGRNAFGIARWDGSLWNPVDEAGAKRLGVNGKTMAIGVAADKSVYVGGTFGFVGGDVGANNIARLKDGAWYPLGNGVGGAVWTIAFKDVGGGAEDLYAGGYFNGSGTAPALNIAKWNGATWSALGAGLNMPVSIIKVGPDGKIYAGGEFTKSGDATVNRIAVWDGATWSPIGNGFADGRVAAIGFGPDGKLYAGGTFKKSGTTDTRGIAVWDGSVWTAVGGGVEGPSAFSSTGVYDIVFYNDKLTISGQFTKVSVMPDGGVPTPLNNVAVFDGTNWTALGGGLPPELPSFNVVQGRRMAIHGTDLYVGGLLERLGDTNADKGLGGKVAHVAKWDGTKWSEVGGGLSDVADEIVSTDDSLWVVGSFTWAGNRGSNWLARYWYGK